MCIVSQCKILEKVLRHLCCVQKILSKIDFLVIIFFSKLYKYVYVFREW